MVDKTRRKPRKQAKSDTRADPVLYTDLLLRLSAFAVLVLQRRARNQHRTIAEIIEALLWNDCYVDEAQEVAQESTIAGRAFQVWLSDAATRRK